jgi:hypothetical protein
MILFQFTCTQCGKTYGALPPAWVEFTPNEIERRRKVWLDADAKLMGAPDNEHYEKAYTKACFAYMETKTNGIQRVPPELISKKTKDGFVLVCAEHERVEQNQVPS